MIESFQIIIFLPVVLGLLLCFLPERTNQTIKGTVCLLISAAVLGYSIRLFFGSTGVYDIFVFPEGYGNANDYFQIHLDGMSRLLVLFAGGFALLITLYALVYQKAHKDLRHFYACFLVTLGCTNGALLSNHLISFLVFWGILGITLYKLIAGNSAESASVAKKTLILIGGADGIMILGIALIWLRSGTFLITDIHLPTDTATASAAFLCLLAGSFTKAGAFPFHTWIPDYTRLAPATSSAFLPASLDKLLGIYLMARLCVDMFILNPWITFILVALGTTTIIIAVMMALVQHNYKKLLGYHAVSQVGYMVLGLGLGSPLGIAGGLFHMLNHAMYKSGLFLTAGSLEKQTGTDELLHLGGLSRKMPVTFVCAIIFALAISGVPPLNGFASKWIIYQAIIEFGQGTALANKLWILWLGLAVLGSALTLASFIKFISGAFLGRIKTEMLSVREVSAFMWIPTGVLALACVAFGIFVSAVVLPYLLYPMVGPFEFIGVWQSDVVAVLIVVSILAGTLIYVLADPKKLRQEDSFVGGELMQETASFSVLEFYKTFSEFKVLAFFYKNAEQKHFDIYDLSKTAVLGVSKALSKSHNGLLQNYAFWLIAGMLILMLLML
jgi:multicomponent Na+:H+ antiporter subunit A